MKKRDTAFTFSYAEKEEEEEDSSEGSQEDGYVCVRVSDMN